MSFIIAVSVIAGLGIIAGAGLALANKVFGVEEDPRVEQITEALPGANCGACGYAGCRGFAQAVLEGADISACAPGGSEVVERVAAILGVEATAAAPKVAIVRCAGNRDVTTFRSEYRGIEDCNAAELVQGGPNACSAGCLGLGTCRKACAEDAIVIENGVAVVRGELCIGCGVCARVCPRDLIEMVPKARKVHVLCSNHDAGKAVRSVCKVGCTACNVCAKKVDGFSVRDNLARASDDAGDEAREAALLCPQGTIVDLEEFSMLEFAADPKAHDRLKKLQKEHKKKLREAKKKAKGKKEASEKKEAEEGEAGKGVADKKPEKAAKEGS
jgi:electron transport complex protein RnfB